LFEEFEGFEVEVFLSRLFQTLQTLQPCRHSSPIFTVTGNATVVNFESLILFQLETMDKNILLKELQAKHNFPTEEFPRLIELFEERCVKKNTILFHEGEVVKQTYFVLTGCLRQYYVSPEGTERTIYFAEEGHWAAELNSFLHYTPTNLNLQALEDSELISLNRKNWELAITTIPALAMYHIKNHQRIIVKLKEDIGRAVNESPDEKYRRLMKENPGLLQRLPQYHIASYLGVTPETLSRIRKRNKLL